MIKLGEKFMLKIEIDKNWVSCDKTVSQVMNQKKKVLERN